MERVGVSPGTEIGGYRVVAPLGHGGSGAVYRAVDGEGVLVALKLLHPHLGEDASARERLTREVSALQRVRHPAVARVLDAEVDQADAFVVTELVDGLNLGDHVRERGPLAPQDVAELADQLREALAVVHAAGVVHRDVSPGNVLMSSRGPVLIDFGIAHGTEDARVTSSGLVSGTPGYVAPELLEGEDPSPSSDWWGWAAVCAFAATGRPPFGTRPVQAVLARTRGGDADLAGLDGATAEVLGAALSPEPEDRPGPDEVVADLVAAASRPPVPGGGTLVLPATGHPERVGHDTWGTTAVLPAEDLEPTDQHRVVTGELPVDDGYGYAATDEHAYDGGYDDHADDGGPDGPADGTAGWDAPPSAPPEPPRRTGSVLALGLVLVALGATRPGVALVLAVVLAVVVRAVGLAVTVVHERRARRGWSDPRREGGDRTRAVVLAPWYLLRAAGGVLPAALVAASLVVVVGGVGWWLLDSRPDLASRVLGAVSDRPWVVPALLALAVAVGLVVLWFGPMSVRTRSGARWTLGALAPGTAGAAAVVLVALAATAALVVLVSLGHETVWWPLPGPPDLR